MNHLGDTNKMVETPRTDGLLTEILDAYGYVHQGNCPQRWVNHARELERELNAAHERIKRLEEFINRFFDPEDLGYVVSTVVRDDAREALGMKRVESGSRVSMI